MTSSHAHIFSVRQYALRLSGQSGLHAARHVGEVENIVKPSTSLCVSRRICVLSIELKRVCVKHHVDLILRNMEDQVIHNV